MNVTEALATYRGELRDLEAEGSILDRRPLVTRRSGAYHSVSAFDLDESNVDAVILGEIEHFRGLAEEFEWKAFSFDRPTDLVDRLGQAGFDVGAREAVLAYDLRAGLAPFESKTSWEVRPVRTMADLATFRSIAEKVFLKDYSRTTEELATALASGRSGHDAFIGSFEGTPASIGRLYTSKESMFGGLYGGGTLADFRGMGGYRAVIAARALVAAEFGARYLVVDALPTSLPILIRLGFVHLADTWPCVFRIRIDA